MPESPRPTFQLAPNLSLPYCQPQVRQHIAEDYDKCPRRFLWKHRFCLKSKYERYASWAFTGSLAHSMLATCYSHPDDPSILGTAKAGAWAIIDATKNEYASKAMDDLTGEYDRLAGQVVDDGSVAIVCFHNFWSKYPLDTSKYEVALVEKELTAPLNLFDLDITLAGRLDLVLRSKRTGDLMIADHKTTARKPDEVLLSAPWSWQTRIYRLLAMAAFPADNVSGVVYNVMQKPTIKFCKKDADFDAYLDRCAGEYAKKGEAAVRSQGFGWDEEPKSEEFMWRLEELASLVTGLPAPSSYPRKKVADIVDNCSKCAYNKLCTTSPNRWGEIIEAGFTQDFEGDTNGASD